MSTPETPKSDALGLRAASMIPHDSDEYYAAQNGGWKVVESDTVTIGAATADQMFPSTPLAAQLVEFSVRGSDINVAFDSGKPPTSVTGHYYRKDRTYRMSLDRNLLNVMSAYALGPGDAELFITYWKAL